MMQSMFWLSEGKKACARRSGSPFSCARRIHGMRTEEASTKWRDGMTHTFSQLGGHYLHYKFAWWSKVRNVNFLRVLIYDCANDLLMPLFWTFFCTFVWCQTCSSKYKLFSVLQTNCFEWLRHVKVGRQK